MKTKIALIAILSLLCIMTLTGCRISINTGTGKEPKVDVKIPGIDVEFNESNDGDEALTNGSTSEEPSLAAKFLKIQNEMGDIQIKVSDDRELKVNYKVKVRGGSEENRDKAAGLVSVAPKTLGNETLIRPLIDGNEKVGEYVRDKFSSTMTVTVELEIFVPAQYTGFAVQDAMGDITLEGLKGGITIQSAMGNVKADDIVVTDNSRIESAMGNVDVSMAGVHTENTSLDIESAMGDIHLYTKGLKTSGMDVKDEGISGSFKVTLDDKLQVSGKAAMGNAKID